MSSHFSLQMLCLQKVITYHWIQFRKIHYLSYENFRNIFLIMDYRNKNLRVLVLFLYQNASRAAPAPLMMASPGILINQRNQLKIAGMQGASRLRLWGRGIQNR